MLPTDPWLFDPNDLRASPADRSPSGPHPRGHSAKRNARSIARSPGFRRSAAHCRAEESRDAAKRNPRHEKTARAAEERARRRELLRKNSLGAIYRRLAKELHPDLERDPAEREKKGRVMQEITAAYARGDLHALLQLELEWLGGPSGEAARLSLEKLLAYTELLKQQATELADEVQSLHLHPRYAALIVEGPFGFPVVLDGPRELERLDTIIVQVRSVLERLSSRDALEEVRSAIREYRDSEKRQTLAGRRAPLIKARRHD